MHRARVCALLPAVAALALLAGCSSGHRAMAPAFDGAAFPPGVRAPGFTLTDERGRTVSLSRYRGRVTVVAFVPPRGRAGRLVAQQVRGALDELGPRAQSVGVALVSAEAPTARAYVSVRGRQLLEATSLLGRAAYLTGTPAQVRKVWRTYGQPPPTASERAFFSSTPVIVLDRAGFERVGFPIEELTPEGLAHDIRALLGGA